MLRAHFTACTGSAWRLSALSRTHLSLLLLHPPVAASHLRSSPSVAPRAKSVGSSREPPERFLLGLRGAPICLLDDDASGRAEESARIRPDPALAVRVSIPSPFARTTTKQKQQQKKKEPWGPMSREQQAQQDDGVSTIDLRPTASGTVVEQHQLLAIAF